MKTLNAARDTQNASRTSYVLRRTLMAERKKPRSIGYELFTLSAVGGVL